MGASLAESEHGEFSEPDRPEPGGVWKTAVAVLAMAALGALLWWLTHMLTR